ncbi:MAG TPA: alanine dehydrogenase [Candidatus Binatia bacterium]|jgi:alanine dehydrogenase|nr:alanine dehydrogenase [Candidatus Binatia bacterium]
MRFGIPTETGFAEGMIERRVALSPAGVQELCQAGAEVVVQQGAGQRAGFTDEEYRAAGAQIVYSAVEAYGRADVILRVERPRDEEWELLPEGSTLIAFLHLHIASPRVLQTLRGRNLTVLGLEAIREDTGSFPLQKISSQIAGRMAPQIAGRLLEASSGGMGVLLSGLPGIPPVDVVILGAGVLGTEAARAFLGAGASVYALDTDVQKLEDIDRLFAGKVVTALATRHNLEKFTAFAEVLVGAVRRPDREAPLLVTRAMVQQMQRGAVILDFAINEGGCVETSRLTLSEDGVFMQEGVVHYALPNVPSLVPRTATYALTQALLPYLRCIATEGVQGALQHSVALQRSLQELRVRNEE